MHTLHRKKKLQWHLFLGQRVFWTTRRTMRHAAVIAMMAVHAWTVLKPTARDAADVTLALWAAVAVHVLECVLCVAGHEDADVPYLFRTAPWVELVEHAGTTSLLVFAITHDHIPGLGAASVLYLVAYPAAFAVVRAIADCVVRRRVYGPQTPTCLVATTMLQGVRAVLYVTCECAAFGVYVLQVDPSCASNLVFTTLVGLRAVWCVLAHIKVWWTVRAATAVQIACT